LGNVEAEPIAVYIDRAEDRLSKLVHKQFRFVAIVVISSMLLLLAVFAWITRFARVPTDPKLFVQIEESNKQLASVTQTLLQSQSSITSTQVLQVVLAQAEAHQKALDELRRIQEEPTPAAQSLLQILGSAAVLTLLGALGFQRLQNIDSEINNVRESVFAQITARGEDIEKVLRAATADQVKNHSRRLERALRTRRVKRPRRWSVSRTGSGMKWRQSRARLGRCGHS